MILSTHACLHFLIISPDPYLTSFFLFMEGNSATFQNILMVLSRIIEQVNMECHIQE